MHLPKPAARFILLLILCLCWNYSNGQSELIRMEQQKLPLLKDSIAKINSLNRIGFLYHMKNLDSCFYYGIKAKALAARLHYTIGETEADNVIAVAFLIRGLYRESLALFSKTLANYKSRADTADIVQVSMNLSTLYARLGDTTKAKLFLQKSLQIGSRLKQNSGMISVYINYCSTNNKLSSDSLRYYLDKSEAIAKKYKDVRGIILVTQMRALYLIGTGRRQQALSLIRKSLSQSHQAGLEYFELNSLGLYANYFSGKPDSIIYYYQRAYKLASADGYVSFQIPILKVILQNLILTGNKDKIISTQHLLMEADAAENENLKKFIGDYVKYNAIQNDNKLLEASNQNKQAKIWLLIGICCIAALLIIIVSRLYRLSRRLNAQISEQNTQMQKTLNALEQSQADNTRMLQIVAHDLRNPIGGMYATASLMLDDEVHSEDDRSMLRLIKDAGRSSLDMVNDLLQVNTKVEQIKKEPLDLSEMLHYCVDLLRHKAEAKGQHLKLQTMHVTVSASREKLWRVVSNLIANAIKFSAAGTVISVRVKKDENKVRIEVEDHGIGIPAEMTDKIFDMLTSAKRPGTAGEQPFGMGLAISKQIVEAHGGRIWFETYPEKGTTFFVELPM